MRNGMSTLLVTAVLTVGFAGPALAHDDDHEEEHDQLGSEHAQGHWFLQNRHSDVHANLAAEHGAAHYYNPSMSRKAHRRLHRQIDQQHAWKDSRLNWQHQQIHHSLNDEHDAYHGDYYGFGNR